MDGSDDLDVKRRLDISFAFLLDRACQTISISRLTSKEKTIEVHCTNCTGERVDRFTIFVSFRISRKEISHTRREASALTRFLRSQYNR